MWGFPGHFPCAAEVSPGIAVVPGTFSLRSRILSTICCRNKDVLLQLSILSTKCRPNMDVLRCLSILSTKYRPNKDVLLQRSILSTKYRPNKDFLLQSILSMKCRPNKDVLLQRSILSTKCHPNMDVLPCRAVEYSTVQWAGEQLTSRHKKRVSLIYRTATTAYPCCLPTLGEFCRSWSYMTYPGTKVEIFL